MTRVLVLLALICIGSEVAAAQTASSAPAAAGSGVAKRVCTVDSTPTNAAETAFDKNDYPAAEKAFRAILASDPKDEDAHEGLVRALIQENRVAEAATEAEQWAASNPSSSMAMVGVGDARLREGDPPAALAAFRKAAGLNLCNARVFYGLYEINSYAGAYASAKRFIDQAYALRPGDDEIHTAWIWSRQRKERAQLLTEYVAHTDQLSDDDREKLKTRLEKDSLYKPTDCRMSAASPRTATVPMQKIMDGPERFVGWGLDVQLNGKRRRLQIDTGASGITISRAAALQLDIHREDATEVGGIGDKGKVKTSIAHVASIKIGDLEFTNCPVEILEKWSVLDTDGLIGADMFHQLQVALDFPKHELRVEPLPDRPGEAKPETGATPGDAEDSQPHDPYIAPAMANWQRIYRHGHDLLIPAAIAETKRYKEKDKDAWKSKLFLLDTGAFNNLISPAAAAEVTKVSRDRTAGVHGISGSVAKVYDTGDFSFAFGGLVLPSVSMTGIDTTNLSHGVGMEVSGLIGAPALFRVVMHIDYRDNLVWCEYDPKN